MSDTSVVNPRQLRSRESFARVRAAVLALLKERGSTDFTIAEISQQANLAVGSIYGRVGNKSALVRLVQDEELVRIEEETTVALAGALPRGDLSADLYTAIAAYVDVLHSNADILRATIRAASTDETISNRGAQAGRRGEELLTAALRRALNRNGVDASEAALAWSHEIIYAIAARQFGIGVLSTGTPGDDEYRDVEELKEELSRTVLLYLTAAAN